MFSTRSPSCLNHKMGSLTPPSLTNLRGREQLFPVILLGLRSHEAGSLEITSSDLLDWIRQGVVCLRSQTPVLADWIPTPTKPKPCRVATLANLGFLDGPLLEAQREEAGQEATRQRSAQISANMGVMYELFVGHNRWRGGEGKSEKHTTDSSDGGESDRTREGGSGACVGESEGESDLSVIEADETDDESPMGESGDDTNSVGSGDETET